MVDEMEQRDILISNNHLKDINPLDCGEHICDKNHGFGPAIREFYLLHYVISGKGTFTCKNGSYQLSKGDIFIIRPYEMNYYVADSTTPWHYCWIGFECTIHFSILADRDILKIPECESIFMDMLKSDRLRKAKELYLCGKIYELLAQINEHTEISNKDTTLKYVAKAKDYIACNYVKNPSVEVISNYLNLNRSYFSTIFKKHEGKSPQQYIVDLRLQKAAELILNYGYSPGEAALNTGYADIFNFSRMFKKKFGVAPSKYKFKI